MEASCPVYAVRVKEIEAPEGIDPVDWKLLTNLKIERLEDGPLSCILLFKMLAYRTFSLSFKKRCCAYRRSPNGST